MPELPRLLLKAFRSLSEEEQETVVSELLGAGTGTWPWPGPRLARSLDELKELTGVGMGPPITPPPIGPEGGPWQSVPVRLSVEQHERLKQWCQTNGFTMAVVLRGLVARFLDDQAARRPRPEAGTPPA